LLCLPHERCKRVRTAKRVFLGVVYAAVVVAISASASFAYDARRQATTIRHDVVELSAQKLPTCSHP